MASLHTQRKKETLPELRSDAETCVQLSATARTAVSHTPSLQPASNTLGGVLLSRFQRTGGKPSVIYQPGNAPSKYHGGNLSQVEHACRRKEAPRNGGIKQSHEYAQSVSRRADQLSSIPRFVAATASKSGSQSTSHPLSGQKGSLTTGHFALRRHMTTPAHPRVTGGTPAGAIRPSPGTSNQFKCTFCGVTLLTRKYFASSWPEFIMCARCTEVLPTCHVCHRKAARAAYADDICWLPSKFVGKKKPTATGLPDQESSRTGTGGHHRPPGDVGGLNLCSECALLLPVVGDEQVSRLLEVAVAILRAEANISFDDTRVFRPTLLGEPAALCTFGDHRNKSAAFPFPVLAMDVASLKTSMHAKHSIDGGHTTFGRCETLEITETQTNAPRVSRTRAIRRILVAKGLPESVFLAHLAHELMHAFLWCSTEGGQTAPSIDLAVEEGLCNVMAARVLEIRDAQLASIETPTMVDGQSCAYPFAKPSNQKAAEALSHAHGSGMGVSRTSHQQTVNSTEAAANAALIAYERKVIAVRLSLMAEDKDKVYGDGYRAVKKAAEALGIKRALHLVRTQGTSLEVFKRAALGSSTVAQTRSSDGMTCRKGFFNVAE
ncbi:hypothetical protein TGME49_244400 [Toxoplasma gondii ME49]|uniref:Protein DA1-like domain-containing protein n=2 Tax=Toxoplasma gondii TaxID=5811 RepID=S8F428_TOXGM|nr:hypothetical protein TGME49_244400 [Toxoplasma gondii ME49]EPT30561.1 hypothetical protein TGME49_244400 [Toxoplasma gondii ME49]KYF40940.1 hypothetical protein TGARI_244400 [Toxoplasma gondii ARI]|eukprot:XP_002366929.1 hypothetical protein TGME49_244400 [Toxoplasma gondii ME49]